MKKYEFTGEVRLVKEELHQIRAVRDFGNVKKGQLGGWIENESNLSHEGNCWVGDTACVIDDATVIDDAQVFGNACISKNAQVSEDAMITGRVLLGVSSRVNGFTYLC